MQCVFCLSGENIIVWLIFSSGRCWSVGFSLGFHGSDERKQSLPGQGALNCLHQQKRHTSDFTPRRIRAARAKCLADPGALLLITYWERTTGLNSRDASLEPAYYPGLLFILIVTDDSSLWPRDCLLRRVMTEQSLGWRLHLRSPLLALFTLDNKVAA